MITLRYRTVGAFLVGVTLVVVTAFALQAWRADAALGDVDTAFVPIAPCRLVDTRPEFNVGARDVPLGADETHVQLVTGARGNCDVPDHASAVSMNVTAVDPTEASFMTVFPSDVVRPVASNLNYLPGAPPTPNKVDVKLSVDGQVSFYNLAGTVHLVADVAGYYTPIDARTTTRSISLPAQALNEDASRSTVEEERMYLRWTDNTNESVGLDLYRPSDWTGSGTVTIKILFNRTSDFGGIVRFRAGVPDDLLAYRHFNSNAQTVPGRNLAEVQIGVPARYLADEWWLIRLQRIDPAVVGNYPDDVLVHSVAVTYEARN